MWHQGTRRSGIPADTTTPPLPSIPLTQKARGPDGAPCPRSHPQIPPGGRPGVWGGGEAGSPPRAAYRVHGRPSPRPPGHRRRRHGASSSGSSSSTAPRPTPPLRLRLRPPWPRGAPVPAPVPARLPAALGLGLGRARGRAEEPRHGRRHLRADGSRPRPRGASARPAAAMGAREPCRRLEAVLGALYDLGG